MNVGVIIPTRGDRPKLLDNCLRMLSNQTLIPVHIALVDYAPLSKERDITQRYRIGYHDTTTFHHECMPLDVVALMEDDDFYCKNYLETMVKAWEKHGKPDIFGTNYTIYYHIRLKKYYQMDHFSRASAMNTLLKPGLQIKWPVDKDPFTDLHLWRQLKGVTFRPDKHISIGIKHGVGLTGGMSHVDRFDRYEPPRGTDDKDLKFLKETLDAESFEFYSNYFSVPV